MTEQEYKNALHDTLDFSIFIGHHLCPNTADIKDEKIHLKTSCAALFIRALTKAHAINVLIDNDLPEEASVILRVLIEIRFIICSIEKNTDLFNKYQNDLDIQNYLKLKDLGNAEKYPECLFKLDDSLKEKLIEMSKKNKGKKTISIRDFAEKAELLGIYYSSYSILCRYIHSGPRDIKANFSIVNKSLIVSRNNNIEYDIIYFSAIEAMNHIIQVMSRVFEVHYDKVNELNDMYNELNSIMHKKYILKEKIF